MGLINELGTIFGGEEGREETIRKCYFEMDNTGITCTVSVCF